jgi:hypothetical protein
VSLQGVVVVCGFRDEASLKSDKLPLHLRPHSLSLRLNHPAPRLCVDARTRYALHQPPSPRPLRYVDTSTPLRLHPRSLCLRPIPLQPYLCVDAPAFCASYNLCALRLRPLHAAPLPRLKRERLLSLVFRYIVLVVFYINKIRDLIAFDQRLAYSFAASTAWTRTISNTPYIKQMNPNRGCANLGLSAVFGNSAWLTHPFGTYPFAPFTFRIISSSQVSLVRAKPRNHRQ